MSVQPLLALIHHNRPDLTRLAVRSIRRNTRAPYKLLVIDNASGDRLNDLDADDLHINQTPCSFAANCNAGIKFAGSSRVVLLNNDIFTPPGWLQGLMAGLDRGFGLTGAISNSEIPLKLNLSGRPFELGFQGAPEDVDGRWKELAEVLGGFNRQGRERPPLPKTMVCFFAVALSRRAVDAVGLLDESFVHGYEDLDYCWRAWATGLETGLAGNAFVVHFGGKSTPVADPAELGVRDRYNLSILLNKYNNDQIDGLFETWRERGLEEEGRQHWNKIRERAFFLGLT